MGNGWISVPQGEFDGIPSRRDWPNHAHQLDSASRVLWDCIPRNSLPTKKSLSVLSVETVYQLCPSEEFRKTKPAQSHRPEHHQTVISKSRWKEQLQQDWNLPLQIHRNREAKSLAPKDFDIVSISGSAIEIENSIRIPRTNQTQPQDNDRNESSKLQINRQLHWHMESFNLTSWRAQKNGTSRA